MYSSAGNNRATPTHILIPSLFVNPLILDIISSDKLPSNQSPPAVGSLLPKKLLWKFHLPPLLKAITTIESKNSWKKTVFKTAVGTFWKEEIENQAKSKSTLTYLNLINQYRSWYGNRPQLTSGYETSHRKCKAVDRNIYTPVQQTSFQPNKWHNRPLMPFRGRKCMQDSHLSRQRGNLTYRNSSQPSLLCKGITLVMDEHMKWSCS